MPSQIGDWSEFCKPVTMLEADLNCRQYILHYSERDRGYFAALMHVRVELVEDFKI